MHSVSNAEAGHVKKARRTTKTKLRGHTEKAKRVTKSTSRGHVTRASRTRLK